MKPLRWLWLFLGSALLLSMGGCSQIEVLNPKGPAARDQFHLFQLTLYLMLAVLAIVIFIYIYFLVKYRWTPERKNVVPRGSAGNKKLEITWTVIPIIILIIIAVPTVQDTYKLSKATAPKQWKDTLMIKVTAHQFWWEFEYPEEGVKTSDVVHIPANRDVVFVITSKDTIHSLWIPQLGGKMDAVPGKTNRLWIKADNTGTYEGKCAELCGAGHAYMLFQVKADSQADFDKWMGQMKQEEVPSTEKEKAGREVFAKTCLSCHAVNDDSFKKMGDSAPNLTGFADHDRIASVLPNTKENLKKWLDDSEKYKPGSKMPPFNMLSKKDKNHLIAYLQSLTRKQDLENGRQK
ncbi:cytochrome c oxidase subunit II [Falsibacillus albus]|uniref:Cytochrome c oxidase subunit 2 n=1 Tax=Falsibacillus albus TaxID=2478915 RepID=A0A3L7K1Q7_9BACI|nr:cytochrome c oxidase subunit II [Falsibacillus albus]RLQ96730.1 cytochrome c oxidase subunit II [Falsibacillus albus]